jgi:hypothetical protein
MINKCYKSGIWPRLLLNIIVISLFNIVIWIFHLKLDYFIHWYDWHYIIIILIYMKLYLIWNSMLVNIIHANVLLGYNNNILRIE